MSPLSWCQKREWHMNTHNCRGQTCLSNNYRRNDPTGITPKRILGLRACKPSQHWAPDEAGGMPRRATMQ